MGGWWRGCDDEESSVGFFNVRAAFYSIRRFSVYVFIGSKNVLVELMKAMEAQEFFENGDHMVIYVNNDVYHEQEADLYLTSRYTECDLFFARLLPSKRVNLLVCCVFCFVCVCVRVFFFWPTPLRNRYCG